MINVAAMAALLLTAAIGYFIVSAPAEPLGDSPEEAKRQALIERKQAAYENLRDLHFEHLAGKLDDADYQTSRRLLENEAAAVVAEIAKTEPAGQPAPRTPAGQSRR